MEGFYLFIQVLSANTTPFLICDEWVYFIVTTLLLLSVMQVFMFKKTNNCPFQKYFVAEQIKSVTKNLLISKYANESKQLNLI